MIARKRRALAIALGIIAGTTAWDSVAQRGRVTLTQPYTWDPTRFWVGRASARRPRAFVWMREGQTLALTADAAVARGTAELTVRGVLVGPARPLVDMQLDRSGPAALAVTVPETGLYAVGLGSDLGAFSGRIALDWRLE